MRTVLPASLLLFPLTAWAADSGGTAASASMGMLFGVAAAAVIVAIAAVAKDRAVGALVAALIGAALSIYLAVHHHGALTGGSSICNVSSTINCDVVNASKHSEIGGVPIALYGLGYYAAIAYVIVRHIRGLAKAAPALLVTGALVALAYDVFLLWAMLQTGAWCVLCITTWAMNGIGLAAAVLLLRERKQGWLDTLGTALADEGGVAVAMGLAFFIGGTFAYRSQSETRDATGPNSVGGVDLTGTYEKMIGRIELDGTEPVKGDPNARFTIVEWADFECPHCATMAGNMPKVLEAEGDLKLLFKHYPISGICNEFVQGDRHLHACEAAGAAECARLQGRFYELSEAMFKNQEYLSSDDIRFIAEQQGLEMNSFKECMANPATMEAVKEDVRGGGTAQIDGTPSLFLKGAFGDEWVKLTVGPDEAPEVIKAILGAVRAGTPLPPPPPPTPHE